MTVPGGIAGETRTQGQPGSHFAKTGHYHEDEQADKGIRNEERPGPGLGKSLTSSDNETSSQSTTNGNHGDVTSFESLVKHGLGRRLQTTNLDIVILVVPNACLLRIAPIAITLARTGINTLGIHDNG